MIVQIDMDHYELKYRDPGILRPEDKGLMRADKVEKDWNGNWFTCDDDDYLINDKGIIVAKETGWGLRRIDL